MKTHLPSTTLLLLFVAPPSCNHHHPHCRPTEPLHWKGESKTLVWPPFFSWYKQTTVFKHPSAFSISPVSKYMNRNKKFTDTSTNWKHKSMLVNGKREKFEFNWEWECGIRINESTYWSSTNSLTATHSPAPPSNSNPPTNSDMVVRSVCVVDVAEISFWITWLVFGVTSFRPFMEEEDEKRLNTGLGEGRRTRRGYYSNFAFVWFQ